MAKITLTFDSFEDRQDAMESIFGGRAHSALSDIYYELRTRNKIGEETVDLEKFTRFFWDTLENHGVQILGEY